MVAGCSSCKLFVTVASKLDSKTGNGCACAPHTTTRTYSLPDSFPKTGEMHTHKRGGPAIKTATRPRTMNRNSRTSSSRNSRNELEYQGSRLRQVTFHGERSRLPRSSRHLLSAARMLCRDRKRRTESRDSKRAKVMKAIPAKVLSGPLTFTCRAPHQKCWTAAWAQKHTCRLGYSPSWP